MAKPAAPAEPAAAPAELAALPERPPLRPHGRSLADFGELFPAEKALLECCGKGELAVIAERRPGKETDAKRVRAGFVRFLALGGDEGAPVHEQGVLLRGAWLIDPLHLDGARIERPLALYDCRIEQISAIGSTLSSLHLNGSLIGGITADGLRCEGGVTLREGFHATGTVRMCYANIGGYLDCCEGRFEHSADPAPVAEAATTDAGGPAAAQVSPDGVGKHALALEAATIDGGVLLRGFHATGRVSFAGAAIGNHLDCHGGRFDNPGGDALVIEGARLSGGLFLRNGFHATGRVSLSGATVSGILSCNGGRFENPGADALVGKHARVTDCFYFAGVDVEGNVVLDATQVGALSDDVASWPRARGTLKLDGFTYARLVDGAPTDAATRIAWLDWQRRSYPDAEFRPQPWEQLIAVLRAMGHPDEARAVAVAKQRRLLRAGKIVRGARTLHWLYGLLVGYGYRPLRLMISIGLVWSLCALAYGWAADPGGPGATPLIAPPDRQPSAACLLARARARNGDPCPAPTPDYRTFVPLVYSADVLLPVVDLGYRDEWEPVVSDRSGNPLFWGQALRFLYWFEIAFGWVAGLFLVGVLGNLIKKD